jgi:hypothetical protein
MADREGLNAGRERGRAEEGEGQREERNSSTHTERPSEQACE